MTGTNLTARNGAAAILQEVIAGGDLSALTPTQRTTYYSQVCESLSLNPLTQPFLYLQLNDRLVLYATRGATDQLRHVRSVSLQIVSREVVDGVYVVTARASTPDGRDDESVGAVPLLKEQGEWKTTGSNRRYFQGTGTFVPLDPADRANQIMRAETKAKRRVTLSICGLGWLDESEVETIAGAQRIAVDHTTGEIRPTVPAPASPQRSAAAASTPTIVPAPAEPSHPQDDPRITAIRDWTQLLESAKAANVRPPVLNLQSASLAALQAACSGLRQQLGRAGHQPHTPEPEPEPEPEPDELAGVPDGDDPDVAVAFLTAEPQELAEGQGPAMAAQLAQIATLSERTGIEVDLDGLTESRAADWIAHLEAAMPAASPRSSQRTTSSGGDWPESATPAAAKPNRAAASAPAARTGSPPATQAQVETIGTLTKALGKTLATNGLTRVQASEWITRLSEERYGQGRRAASA